MKTYVGLELEEVLEHPAEGSTVESFQDSSAAAAVASAATETALGVLAEVEPGVITEEALEVISVVASGDSCGDLVACAAEVLLHNSMDFRMNSIQKHERDTSRNRAHILPLDISIGAGPRDMFCPGTPALDRRL